MNNMIRLKFIVESQEVAITCRTFRCDRNLSKLQGPSPERPRRVVKPKAIPVAYTGIDGLGGQDVPLRKGHFVPK